MAFYAAPNEKQNDLRDRNQCKRKSNLTINGVIKFIEDILNIRKYLSGGKTLTYLKVDECVAGRFAGKFVSHDFDGERALTHAMERCHDETLRHIGLKLEANK